MYPCVAQSERLDLAYAAFFRRVKAGEVEGFPRFRSVERFSGWGHNTHGDGWRLHAGMACNTAMFGYLASAWSSCAAKPEPPVKSDRRSAAQGRALVFIHHRRMRPARAGGAVAMDWGLETFATVCSDENETLSVPNPRFLDKPQRQKLVVLPIVGKTFYTRRLPSWSSITA